LIELSQLLLLEKKKSHAVLISISIKDDKNDQGIEGEKLTGAQCSSDFFKGMPFKCAVLRENSIEMTQPFEEEFILLYTLPLVDT